MTSLLSVILFDIGSLEACSQSAGGSPTEPMDVQLQCAKCMNRCRVAPSVQPGTHVRCTNPACGAILAVPVPSQIGCGGCKTLLRLAPGTQPGSHVKCTTCHLVLAVPGVAPGGENNRQEGEPRREGQPARKSHALRVDGDSSSDSEGEPVPVRRQKSAPKLAKKKESSRRLLGLVDDPPKAASSSSSNPRGLRTPPFDDAPPPYEAPSSSPKAKKASSRRSFSATRSSAPSA